MSKPKILVVDGAELQGPDWAGTLARYETVSAPSLWRGLMLLQRDQFEAVYVGRDHIENAVHAGNLLQNERILDALPDGVLLVNSDGLILCSNAKAEELAGRDALEGMHWEKALGSYTVVGCGNLMAPTEIGPCEPSEGPAFVDALRGDAPVTATLHQTTPGKGKPEARYLRLHATPLREKERGAENLVLVLRDVTTEVLQQQKLVAIHKAGVELADLTADELADLTVEQRINLLKDNILRFTKDVLDYEVVEVRLLDRATGRLEPLLSEGMQPEAAVRELHARPEGNGVTGFVASTGKSYLCRDTSSDPHYLEGAKDAKSSLTVPLVLHDEVIGTFNVESQNANNFSENDLLFLEIFARDVASALHTLELLVAQQATTTAKSVEKIHSAVALPIDMILNDAVMVMEAYIGHEPSVVERLRRILRNARDIKTEIQKLGRSMTPAQAVPVSPDAQNLPNLDGSQILVVDADAEVRSQAHTLLERYGCVVETAHEGGEAVHMARNGSYHAIIADIRLPDMTGYELLLKLCDVLDSVPLILMTGFGWDRDHTMVKARRAGVQSFLYKPFRLDLLLDTLAKVKPIESKGRSGDGDPPSTS